MLQAEVAPVFSNYVTFKVGTLFFLYDVCHPGMWCCVDGLVFPDVEGTQYLHLEWLGFPRTFRNPHGILNPWRCFCKISGVGEHSWYVCFFGSNVSVYGQFIAICCKLNRSTYVQETLVIDRRGCTGRDLTFRHHASCI